jgi:hypothetical protein
VPLKQPFSQFPAETSNPVAITRLIGIYNADGGIVGEARYVVGHLLGLTSCSLCDITHSPIRRKPEWDAMVTMLPTPLTVLHKNELEPDLEAWVTGKTLPLVVGVTDPGQFTVVLDPPALESVEGSVAGFATLLARSLETS